MPGRHSDVKPRWRVNNSEYDVLILVFIHLVVLYSSGFLQIWVSQSNSDQLHGNWMSTYYKGRITTSLVSFVIIYAECAC
jgi:hypothetical protein